jgi:hypothetical protein
MREFFCQSRFVINPPNQTGWEGERLVKKRLYQHSFRMNLQGHRFGEDRYTQAFGNQVKWALTL